MLRDGSTEGIDTLTKVAEHKKNLRDSKNHGIIIQFKVPYGTRTVIRNFQKRTKSKCWRYPLTNQKKGHTAT